jgi:hypothetical protein
MECLINNSLLAVRWISVTGILVLLGNVMVITLLSVGSSWTWTYGISTLYPIVFLSTSSFLTARVALVSDILRLLSNRIGAITLRSRRGMVYPRSSRISLGVVVVVVPVIPWRPNTTRRCTSWSLNELSIDSDLGRDLRLLNKT